MPPIEKSEHRKLLAEKAAAENKVEVNLEKIAGKAKEADMEISEELYDKFHCCHKALKDFQCTRNSQERGSY